MKEFFKSLFSWTVALNLLAMLLLSAGLLVGAYFLLGEYTNHGEKVKVPNIEKMPYDEARRALEDLGLELIVGDTVFNKRLPADIVLEQVPAAGKIVKSGRYVYVMLNAGESPRYHIPDIIDNSSNREAQARLKAMGYKHIDVLYVAGEKEWLYGIKSNGHQINNGDKISVDAHLVFLVGDGMRDLGDSITYVDSPFYYEEEEEDYGSYSYGGGREDDFYDRIDVDAPLNINIDAEMDMLRDRENQEVTPGIEPQ